MTQDRHEGLRPGEQVDPETGEIVNGSMDQHDEGSRIEEERNIPSVNSSRSLRSRLSNIMGMVLIIALGGGFLLWYYSAQFARMAAAEDEAKQHEAHRAGGEMGVPPLGQILAPRPPTVPAMTTVEPEPPLFVPPPPTQSVGGGGPQGPAQPSPEDLARQRRLQTPVLAGGPGAAARAIQAAAPAASAPGLGAAGGAGPLAAMWSPTSTPTVQAKMLPTLRYLLPKGATVDCTNLTAIDSTYDGMVTCIGANDVFSADGSLVLLEAGTKYVGEKRGEIKRGQGRVFVMWNEARTPPGVVVDLASPGADELGRAGLPGHIDTHFWDRFGAAILISVIDGSIQALANTQNSGDGTTIQFDGSGTREIMTEVLKETVNIPPTVIKNQGERIQIMVARDVDFRSVYELRRR